MHASPRPKRAPALTATLAAAALAGAAHAVNITIDPDSATVLDTARSVGINVEMNLLDDRMWAANGHWLDELFRGTGIEFLRWGYGAWQWHWDREQPLSFEFWSRFNRGDAGGSFGLREFLEYCRETGTTPMIMIPARVAEFPEHSWADVRAMAVAMAEYVHGLDLATDVYFELGNEPSFVVDQSVYESRLADLVPAIKAVDPDFRVGASVDPFYDEVDLQADVGPFIDFMEFHRYAPMQFWSGYQARSDDDFFPFAAPAGVGEAILGEANILWPDWNGRMPNDLQGSLALLNGLLGAVDARRSARIATWPSHWPALGDDAAYGLFDYDAWFAEAGTRLFTGPVWAHRIVNENVLSHGVHGEASNDAQVRVFGFTNAANDRLNVVLINKSDNEQAAEIDTGRAFDRVHSFALRGQALDDEAPVYEPLGPPAESVAGSFYNRTLPAASAVVLQFFDDDATEPPGSFDQLAPAPDAEQVSTFKTFEWAPSAAATDYRLVIARDPAMTDVVFDRHVGRQTRYQLLAPLLSPARRYHWRVEARNAAGSTPAGNAGIAFETDGAPPPPVHDGELRNGDFEKGFTGWTSWGGLVRTSDPAEVHSGEASGLVENGGAAGGGAQELVGVLPGTAHRFDFAVKSNQDGTTIHFGADFFDRDGAATGSEQWSLEAGTSWGEHSFTTRALPYGTWRIRPWFWKDAGPALFVDAFDRTLVGPESSVAAVSGANRIGYLPMDSAIDDVEGNLAVTAGAEASISGGEGRFGGALRADGSGLVVGDHPDFTAGNGPFARRTIALWFRADAARSADRRLLFETGDDRRGINAYVDGGTLYAGGWDTIPDAGDEATWAGTWRSTAGVEPGRWHHVAVVLDASADPGRPHRGAFRAYLDGVEFDRDADVGMQIGDHPGGAGLAAPHGASRFHDGFTAGAWFGSVDDFAVWNRALAADEVARLAAIPPPPNAPSNLSATLRAASVIELQWTDRADDETGYVVDAAEPGQPFATAAELPPDATAFAFSGEPGRRYVFRVKAAGLVADSAWSGEASAETCAGVPYDLVMVDGFEERFVCPIP